MKAVIAALLLLGACGCAKRADIGYQSTLDATTLAIRRGELDTARTLAERGVAVTRSQPDSPWARRFSLLLGEVLLRRHELSDARQLLSAELPRGPEFDLLRARREFLRGWTQLLGENDEKENASTTLARARLLTPASDDLRLDIDVLDGISQLQRGRNEQGESLLNGVLRDATARGDRYHQAVALLNLGYGELIEKRYDAALTWLERALSFTDLSDLTVYADALNNAGICYSRMGQFERAAAAQERAVQRHERGTRREYEQALGQLGSTYLQWGEVRKGLPYLRQALTVATESGLAADAAIWAGNLASGHADLGEWNEAERFNEDGKRLKNLDPPSKLVYNTLNAAYIAFGRGRLEEAVQLFDRALASARTDPGVVWSAHAGLARVAVTQKRIDVATRHFEIALQTIEKTRSDLLKTEYRLSFLTQLISFYRAYVDTLVDQGQIERALEVADSSRGRVLAERQQVAPAARASAATFRSQAGRSRMTFLSYWLAPTRSYLWVVTPAKTELVRLPPAQVIETLIRQHRAAIDNVLADPIATRGGAGDKLFDLLVRPALPSVSHSVLVVPDGALYALNLETLPVDGASRHYWIEDVEIQVAPALAMLEAPPSAAADAPASSASLLLIGNPTPRDPDFQALKYADLEMTNVASHFSPGRVTLLQGERAVPAAYRQARPDQFSIVHFTAHATTNVESPLDSAVILSGRDGAFKLYARDVAAVPLHAELVTVSACRSAGERTYSGEGLVGFAWAFLRGGARRVIAGLWDVDDRSTAELMDLLYRGMVEGAPAGQALREAKLSLLRKGGTSAQPYYWGPFELFTLSP